jgi:hypothetical protein
MSYSDTNVTKNPYIISWVKTYGWKAAQKKRTVRLDTQIIVIKAPFLKLMLVSKYNRHLHIKDVPNFGAIYLIIFSSSMNCTIETAYCCHQ